MACLSQTDELYHWLCSFINMEKGGLTNSSIGGTAFKLDRVRILADLAGHPESAAPVIHIAGSKGKGSVAAMTASILEAAGIRTARYMSPHVNDWRERICRGDGALFPETVYAAAGKELRALYETLDTSSEPTFFELTTMLFFLCARLDACQAMVVETGLGGRLDATNIVDPAVSVITVIEKEHTEYLGNTLAAIAGEKAGIIKNNRPVVSAGQKPEVLAVLRRYAEKTAAPFFYLPNYAAVDFNNARIHRGGTDFTLKLEAPNNVSFTHRLSIPIPGRVYALNAALAVLAAALPFPQIQIDHIEQGLAAVPLPARFETFRSEPPFIVDGAHTPLSAGLCAETFCTLYGTGGILLFGCAAGKDSGAMAEQLVPCFDHCIITAPGSFKASDPEAVYRSFCAAAEQYRSAGKNKPDIVFISDTGLALQETIRLSEKTGRPVLACGSFYLAAEVRNITPDPPFPARYKNNPAAGR